MLTLRPTSPHFTRVALCVAALVLVLVFVAIPLRGRAKHRRITDSPFGAYAGYLWLGHVSSVEGSWTVPRIVDPSRSGLATTWIGAQASGARGAFIQIGASELHGYSRAHVAENRYWAFWSDTTRNFHPQFLFRVRPDDALSASLTLAHGRWTLAIIDHTSGSDVRFSTSEDANASFDDAQWTQEDARTATGEPFPYPSLTAVRFSGLAINSATPAYASLYSTWMSVNGVFLAPTPLAGDAFALRRATINSAGEQYLHIGALKSTARQTFWSELERWTAKTPYITIASASSRLVASLRSDVRALAAARLPKRLRSMIRLLIRKLDVTIERARPPAVRSPVALTLWRSSLISDAEALQYVAHLLLRALGLPELP
jgi:Peptidase A4 family